MRTACVLAACAFITVPAWGRQGTPGTPGNPTPAQSSPKSPPRFAPPARPIEVDNRPRPFDERTMLPMDLAKACERAKADDQRVLVIWGRNGAERTSRLVAVVTQPDNAKTLAIEYQVLWVNVGEGPHAARNLELASAFGVETTTDAEHAALSIHGTDGLPIARTTADMFNDAERPGHYSPLKLEDFIAPRVSKQPPAKEVVDGTLERARAEDKAVFVRFYEFGEDWADKFERLLARPEIAKIVAAHTLPVRLHVQRNPGTMDMLSGFMPRAQSYPLYIMLGPDGKLLGMSQPDGRPNIGYPTDDGEIARFIELLNSGPSKLTEAEVGTIRSALKPAAAPPAPGPAQPPAPKP